MRLGGPVWPRELTPEAWIAEVRRMEYRAAYCPVDETAPDDLVRALADAAREADVVIAEVGAWSNPISPDPAEAKAAIELCRRKLDLAERVGARCCVNIAGSRNPERWDGPHPRHAERETFDAIVESVRAIIDGVKPKRARYTLEPMPWVPPDSADSYLALLGAIDRPQAGVHFDPVNLVNSPEKFYRNAGLIREFVAKLGPRIVSVHVKDIRMDGKLTVHLDEVRPGLGGLDHRVLFEELGRLDPDLPVLVEHLPSREEYALAVAHLRGIAGGPG